MAHIQISYVGFIFINTIVFCKVATEFSVKKKRNNGHVGLGLSNFGLSTQLESSMYHFFNPLTFLGVAELV